MPIIFWPDFSPPLDQEVMKCLARSKLCCDPLRLLAATGPGFRPVVRVPVFWKHRRIGTSLVTSDLELAQEFVKPGSLLKHLAAQLSKQIFTKLP
jgi:hypothetical protein